MHGSVVSSAGRPLHIIDEVREVSAGFSASAEFLNGTRPSPPGLAVHVSTLAWTQFRFQSMAQGFDYLTYMKEHIYRPLMDVHLRADLVDPRRRPWKTTRSSSRPFCLPWTRPAYVSGSSIGYGPAAHGSWGPFPMFAR